MDCATIETKKHAVSRAGPRWVSSRAIEAHFILRLVAQFPEHLALHGVIYILVVVHIRRSALQMIGLDARP